MERSLAWAVRSTAAGARLLRRRRLQGATTGIVLDLAVLAGDGRMHRLVLKLYALVDETEPDQAFREARVLDLVAGIRVATPQVVAVDRDGFECGLPALLMTRVPGRLVYEPRDLHGWLRELAGLLPQIHSAPVPQGVLPDYRSYGIPEPAAPPAFTRRPELWRRAIEIFKGPAPAAERTCFIHRDFHPGNVLWLRRRPSGVLDWLHGCWGPPSTDLGHCRWNIWALHGREAADEFLAEYRRLVPDAPPYDRYWDLAAALGGLSELDGLPRSERSKPWRRWRVMEEIVEAAVAQR